MLITYVMADWIGLHDFAGYCAHVGRAYGSPIDATANDVFLTALPQYHMGGQGHCLMLALLADCTIVLEPQFSTTFPRACSAR